MHPEVFPEGFQTPSRRNPSPGRAVLDPCVGGEAEAEPRQRAWEGAEGSATNKETTGIPIPLGSGGVGALGALGKGSELESGEVTSPRADGTSVPNPRGVPRGAAVGAEVTERGSNPRPGSVGPAVTPVPQECGPLPARLALIPAGSGMCGDSCACARLTSPPAGKRCRDQGLLLRGERGGKEPVLPLTLRLPAGPGSAGSRGGERGHSCTQIPVLGQRCGPAPSI